MSSFNIIPLNFLFITNSFWLLLTSHRFVLTSPFSFLLLTPPPTLPPSSLRLTSHSYSLLTPTYFSILLTSHSYSLLLTSHSSLLLTSHSYLLLTPTNTSLLLTSHSYSLLTSTCFSLLTPIHFYSLLTPHSYSLLTPTHSYLLLTPTHSSLLLTSHHHQGGGCDHIYQSENMGEIYWHGINEWSTYAPTHTIQQYLHFISITYTSFLFLLFYTHQFPFPFFTIITYSFTDFLLFLFFLASWLL